MAWRIDDVDPNIFPLNRGRLCQNGDAAFLLEITGVHDTFINMLVVTKGARLFHDAVDQCGFAMVNMGNDRNIAQFLGHHHFSLGRCVLLLRAAFLMANRIKGKH